MLLSVGWLPVATAYAVPFHTADREEEEDVKVVMVVPLGQVTVTVTGVPAAEVQPSST